MGALGAVKLFRFRLYYDITTQSSAAAIGVKERNVERVTYILLALLHSRIAVRVGHFRALAKLCSNATVDEAKHGDSAEGDDNGGAEYGC